ncbi:hypothetical protein ACH5RR_026177 [Cinchona calisaya]|uniref:Generative cell specific-1/HAP2 domain-containing protein n=1 Tax=Cinchona calisaya TaxID=153742 RepID=A0ABD2Z550_9GENT
MMVTLLKEPTLKLSSPATLLNELCWIGTKEKYVLDSRRKYQTYIENDDQFKVVGSLANFPEPNLRHFRNSFPYLSFGVNGRCENDLIIASGKGEPANVMSILGPENRTATSSDNFLKANTIGDYVGYTCIPSFENFYLVVPRQDELSNIYNINGREGTG